MKRRRLVRAVACALAGTLRAISAGSGFGGTRVGMVAHTQFKRPRRGIAHHGGLGQDLASDLAAKNPAKLEEMKALFLAEAAEHNVLPLDDRVFERALASMVGRPDLFAGRTSLTLAEGMTGMMENAFISVKNKSKTITAQVDVPESGANGAILVQGGRFGGWALYVKDGVPAYCYNFLGLLSQTIAGSKPLPAGKRTLRFEFAYDGGGLGKGGTGTLFVDDEKVAEGRIDQTEPMIFSADETADVGIDLGTPVVDAIGSEHRSRFTGRIPKVTVEVK